MKVFQNKKGQRLFAAFIGVSCVFTLLLIVCGILILTYKKQADILNEQVIERSNQLLSNVRNSLDTLNQFSEGRCTVEQLNLMRQMQFSTLNIKDIGFFNSEERLVCTTGKGFLLDVVYEEGADFHSKSGLNFSINVPLVLLDGKENHHIIRYGAFNAVIRNDSQYGKVHNVLNQSLYLWEPDQKDSMLFEGTGPAKLSVFPTISSWEFKDEVLRVSLCSETSPVCTITQAYFFDIFENEWAWMVFGLGVSVLLSVLISLSSYSRIRKRFSLRSKVRRGINADQVLCYYQPIVDLKSDRVIGCEVLCRWQDEEGTLVMPDDFLSYVQAENLTWALTEIIFRKTVLDLIPLVAKYPDFKIAFNVFPRDFDDHKLITLVDSHRLGPNIKINFELTESEFADDQTLASSVKRLRDHGLLVSVDDFGTGYSNLSKLTDLEVDFIKIDKSFVFEMDHEAVRSSIVPHIVEIGKTLNIELIAEGIENSRQEDILKQLGVEYGQGYLYSRPLPISDFERFLLENEKQLKRVSKLSGAAA